MSSGQYRSDLPVTVAQTLSAYATCFSVRAAADPGALPRILELFAKRGLVPTSVQARLIGAGDIMAVDLQVDGLEPSMVEIIAESLRQLVLVERVLTAELLHAPQAA
jgi:acetolactate synthase small subunit